MERKKFGWTSKGLVGLIFLPLGLIYLVLGVCLGHLPNVGGPAGSRLFLYIFGGLGLVFSVLGFLLLASDLHRRALLRRAWESGNYVMATIADISPRGNVRINGRSPYVVECHYTEPGRDVTHVYFSRDLYTDVRDLLKSDQVPVYIDRMNEDVGFVDIDAVLPEIRIHK